MTKKKRVLIATAMVGALCTWSAAKPAAGEETPICYRCVDGWEPGSGQWEHIDFFSFELKTHQDDKHSEQAPGACTVHTAYATGGS